MVLVLKNVIGLKLNLNVSLVLILGSTNLHLCNHSLDWSPGVTQAKHSQIMDTTQLAFKAERQMLTKLSL